MGRPLFDDDRLPPRSRHHHVHRPVPPTPRQKRMVEEGPRAERCKACDRIPTATGFCGCL